jgi:PST family polysaccharide transporter
MAGRHRKRPGQGGQAALATRASRALGFSFFSNLAGRLGTLPVGIVLARLLGPHSFGTFAVALLALMALLRFNDLNVGLAIVRWERDPAEIAPTVATLSVAASLCVYAGCIAGAPAFAAAMGAPAAAGVLRVLALNVIVDGLVATPAALMQRQFRQDRKMIADQVNNWLGAAVSIALAAQGYGAMSLAVGRMTGAAVSAVLFFAFSPLPVRFGWDRRVAGRLLRFSLPLAGSSLIMFAVTNVDQIVVGHLLGATDLGYYALAVNLAAWPVAIFSRPARSVAPAVFSRMQHHPAAMRGGFLAAAGLLAAVTVPICLFISGARAPLIGLVYGARWLPAASALGWLAVLAALRIGFELCYDYLVVLRRSRAVLVIQVIWLAALAPALVIGTEAGGIAGAALAGAAAAGCVVGPAYLIELRRVGIGARQVAGRLWAPAGVGALVTLAAALSARTITPDLAALAVGGFALLAGLGLLSHWIRPGMSALGLNLRAGALAPGPVAAVGSPGAASVAGGGYRPAPGMPGTS